MARSVPAPMAGRYAIVTGGSRGIGHGIAIEIAAKGAAGVAITYVNNKTAADGVVAELHKMGTKAVAIKADLFSPNFGDHVVNTALKELQTKELHVIVNNAGYLEFNMTQTFEDSTMEQFDKYMHGNGTSSSNIQLKTY